MPFPEKVLARLKQLGYKETPQRVAVLRIISSTREHLTPLAIYQRLRQDQPGIGLVTVYRTLNMLSQLGFICEVVGAGDNTRSYVLSSLEHHDHLICSRCGTVVDFTDCNVHELEQRLTRDTGFTIEDHRLEFFGYCRECRKAVKA